MERTLSIEEAQSRIITQLRNENAELKARLQRYAGIVVGCIHEFGNSEKGILRIRKKSMSRVRANMFLNAGIDGATKDLIVTMIPQPISNMGPKSIRPAKNQMPEQLKKLMEEKEK